MAGTSMGGRDREVGRDVEHEPAQDDYVSVWVDRTTELIQPRGGPPLAKVRGDDARERPAVQPQEGHAYFATWTAVQGDRELSTRPVLVKKRTIQHLRSDERWLSEHRQRALENQHRWQIEIDLLTGSARRINEAVADREASAGLAEGSLGRLPELVGYWIDDRTSSFEDETIDVDQRGPYVCLALSRLPGETLHDLVTRHGDRLDADDAAAVVEAFATTLQQVHDAGYWYGDVSEHNALARKLPRNGRWVVDLCDVEHLTPHDPGLAGASMWGGTRPFATVMWGDNRASYESDLANLAYRACLLYFGPTADGSCPTEPPPDSDLPTPLLGLLQRAARSTELRRDAAKGGGPPRELADIARFGTWVRWLTPRPDEDDAAYVARVHELCRRKKASRQVRRDLVEWAGRRDPRTSPVAVALAVKIALVDSAANRVDDVEDVDRMRTTAALRAAKLAKALSLPEIRDVFEQVRLDPTAVEDDIPARHSPALRQLVKAFPDANWKTRTALDTLDELTAVPPADRPVLDALDAVRADGPPGPPHTPDPARTAELPVAATGSVEELGDPVEVEDEDRGGGSDRPDTRRAGGTEPWPPMWRRLLWWTVQAFLVLSGFALVIVIVTAANASMTADVDLSYAEGDEPDVEVPTCASQGCVPGPDQHSWGLATGGDVRTTYRADGSDEVSTLAGQLYLRGDDCADAAVAWEIRVDDDVVADGVLREGEDAHDLTHDAAPSARTDDEVVLVARRDDDADCRTTLVWTGPGYERPGWQWIWS